MVEHLPRMKKVLGLIPTLPLATKEGNKTCISGFQDGVC